MTKNTASPEIPTETLALLNAYQDPAVLLDLDYFILAANPAYVRAFGDAPLSERSRCYEVSHGYAVPCDQAGESCPLHATLASHDVSRVMHIHHTPRGAEHVDVETHPVPGADGSIHYVLEIMRQTLVASATPSTSRMVGRSPAFRRMLEMIQRAAPSEAAVLLLGETGTGKEMVAQAIHESSARRDGPFVPVECAGLTETLFESELFGHEKGAFTGATSLKTGLVEAARGGTLFLDEVGDIPLSMQVKLLRLLETGCFRRVGSAVPQEADFRLVCATHRDLKALVASDMFRLDLYFRIGVFPILLPSLRQRREDLPLLVEALMSRLRSARGKRLTPAAFRALEGMGFPGNIRELRNVLERASLLADGDSIQPADLIVDLEFQPAGEAVPPADTVIPLDELERQYLARVVAQHPGDRQELARQLGVSERTLYRKLQRLEAGTPEHEGSD
ncbi:sigma54 specific transcriptional regulator, Fis family - like protein [Thioalkalivibrio nitratireducens DSM 14787]|uniref:Sigma54 specific transcriptional regulator, Fis family-like protein n=1 Tax=Thioalkalivibrio nitratireducens (strain DSM 14787 / UNIQEM 213 / ALEN2) TaxID=1255043 RepID=L0DY48_THIND|nr:sigma-54-dependent Fis family transcriptional regulator [Thioalkalivibrio nitratireducens]AGA34529.1 sigma54 specific transcriptional regulator, Fis family - like protein [Thioalkalivibrio nitratireducens DSM 14787]